MNSGRTLHRSTWLGAVVVALGVAALSPAVAQTCTTQAKMTPEVRSGLADAALALGKDVQQNAAARIEAQSIPAVADNFAPTGYLIRTTSEKLLADTLQVTQLYVLDATTRQPGDTGEADFTCALSDSTAETDFAIPSLPQGRYGFAMVEGSGARPWLMAFVLQQQGTAWKLAGFSSHARTVAGHDGLWYWTQARDAAQAGQTWRAWVLYGEADQLLRPAAFVDSTHLDKLHSEQHGATPPELSDGISTQTPLVIKGADGAEFHFTEVSSDSSEDGLKLNLMLHYAAEPAADATTGRARNVAAARAFLDAHKELRQGFDGVWVFADSAGAPPFATEHKVSDIP
jgi:hypothetical protein